MTTSLRVTIILRASQGINSTDGHMDQSTAPDQIENINKMSYTLIQKLRYANADLIIE
jgi:hypothetical protein